jgi:hypothetical protein
MASVPSAATAASAMGLFLAAMFIEQFLEVEFVSTSEVAPSVQAQPVARTKSMRAT